MNEVIYARTKAITNTVIYAVFVLLSLLGLATRETWWGRALMLLLLIWSFGGACANWRAIRHGFVDLDEKSN